MFTTQEICGLLRISRRTLSAWRHNGRGPRAMRIGGQLRFIKEDLDEWLGEQYRAAIQDQAARRSQ